MRSCAIRMSSIDCEPLVVQTSSGNGQTTGCRCGCWRRPTFGPTFYRHLFWETGMVGQVLYLEAEAAGARGTGIGCFYDDPVHDVLGLSGHTFQSLYHFTVGIPVEDTRLTTEPGYEWEKNSDRGGRPNASGTA